MDLFAASRLGPGHVNDLARAAFDEDVTVFAQSRTLDAGGCRQVRRGRLQNLMVFLARHFVVVDVSRREKKGRGGRGSRGDRR